ncbi:DNA alkylation repair protein [Aquimarina sp. 2201CG5-10]|uniref:DNA alkylation repair protein n=1 Tax=Aquimarina callyspongiae TaxID=3098150 RepID=UPI002AB50DFE|nr:DNA alkylation repair protein [Aquimarina sp. 2201CG5-10]MDY8138935.1 DNA alkylation repair protein [Aquimarina sp. 2201CG5-10]
MDFVSSLILKFEEHANPKNAIAMETYMRNLFPYYGIKVPLRRKLYKGTFEEFKTGFTRDRVIKITETLYQKPQRELHHCGIELVERLFKNKYEISDIDLIRMFITTNSWWDSVDMIAKNILGNYLLQFENKTELVIKEFSASENIWLNRSAIIFQLGYKDKTNADLLFAQCEKHKHSDEFFIKKAIGWALREYSKTNPEAVLSYASTAKLKPLSKIEALRKIKSNL